MSTCSKCNSKKLYITETFTQCDSCQYKWNTFKVNGVAWEMHTMPLSGKKIKINKNWQLQALPTLDLTRPCPAPIDCGQDAALPVCQRVATVSDIADATSEEFYESMVEEITKEISSAKEFAMEWNKMVKNMTERHKDL